MNQLYSTTFTMVNDIVHKKRERVSDAPEAPHLFHSGTRGGKRTLCLTLHGRYLVHRLSWVRTPCNDGKTVVLHRNGIGLVEPCMVSMVGFAILPCDRVVTFDADVTSGTPIFLFLFHK